MEIFLLSLTRKIQCARILCTAIKPNLSHETDKIVLNNKRATFQSLIESNALVNQIFKKNESINDEQWLNVRTDLIDSWNVSKSTLDANIFSICFYYKKYDIAKSYFKFLESNNYELQFNIYGNYIKTFSMQDVPINEEEEKEILRVYNNLRQKYNVLDKNTCCACIATLSLTKNWRESLVLLQMIEEAYSSTGVNEVSMVVNACFNNNEAKLAWKIMNEKTSKYHLRQDIYVKYLDYCKRNFDSTTIIKEVEKIFLFWRKYNIYPLDRIVYLYTELYKSLGYSIKDTSITKQGICKSCSQLLQTTTINKEEFKQLSQSFMQNAIIGKNILYASSPQELKRYMIFINSMKPYNLVIDGLNVAYAMRTKTEAGSLKPILDIVEEFHKKGQRVLVIGRIHMLWWSKKTMKLIQEKADTFFTKNISEDDPFLLHVTLMSGPQTYFISRDLMRNLKYKLIDPNLKNVFKTWQLSRQYLYKINKHKKTVELIEPVSFEMKTQKSEKGWHIPFTCDTKLILPDSYSLPEKWICLKNKK